MVSGGLAATARTGEAADALLQKRLTQTTCSFSYSDPTCSAPATTSFTNMFDDASSEVSFLNFPSIINVAHIKNLCDRPKSKYLDYYRISLIPYKSNSEKITRLVIIVVNKIFKFFFQKILLWYNHGKTKLVKTSKITKSTISFFFR